MGCAAVDNEPVLTVLIPVYNEEATIRQIVSRVLDSPVVKDVVVIDDASTDATAQILAAEYPSGHPQVRVVHLERNAGKGAAIRAAIPYATAEYVVIQDADMEYDPADFPAMVAEARDGGNAVVYGTRFAHGMPRMRLPNRIVNILLAAMVRVLYGQPMSDEATCYKLFRRDLLQRVPLRCNRFEFCPEVTAKVIRMGYRIAEVPIRYQARSMAEGKKIRWTDGVQAIWTLLRYRFWRPPANAGR